MANTRDFSPRGRPRSFAYSRQSFGTPGVRSGIHVIKRLPGIEYCRPSWNATETILRIFPGLNPENPKEFDSFKVSEELGRYGVWQCCYEAARKFGEPATTFLLHDNNDPHYNPYLMNPCWILYRAIKDACEKGQGKSEWFPLINRSGKTSQTLTAPTEIVLVQGALFRHNSKDQFGDGRPPFGAGPQDPTVVFELSKSAASQMFNLFEERIPNWQGDPDDIKSFAYGDPVAIDDGVFVHIYEQGTEIGQRQQVTSASSIYAAKPNASRAGNRGGGGGQGAFGYACHLTKTLDGGPSDIPAALTGHEDIVRQKWKHWDDILLFQNDIEQAHLINTLFPPSAILYAFRDRKEWILEETRKSAVGNKVFDMATPAAATALAKQASWGSPVLGPTSSAVPTVPAPSLELMQKALAGDPEALAAITGGTAPAPTIPKQTTPPAVKSQSPWEATMGDDTAEDASVPAMATTAPVSKVVESNLDDSGLADVESALEAARSRASARSRISPK